MERDGKPTTASRRPKLGRKPAGKGPKPSALDEPDRLILRAPKVSIEDRLRSAVLERLGASRFDLWFGEGVKLGLATRADGVESIEIGVPNAFFREWIEGHFAGNLTEAAEEVTGKPLPVTFRIEGDADADPKPEPTDLERNAPGFPAGQGEKPPVAPFADGLNAAAALPTTSLERSRPDSRQQYFLSTPAPSSTRNVRRLDDFVTGSCNRLAHAASMEMAGTLGASFNPLVIHGGVGLGKTHLIEGIGHAMRATRPGLRLIQVTAEAFTNGFLDAMRTASLGSFRARYRGAEALIVDDIHFLAAKRATQDEFLHTFNALMSEGVPVILACDQHPKMVSKLTEELATRFQAGMVVKVDAPDPSTRKAILKTKALARGVDLPDAVIDYMAEHLRSTVRELEGALHSVIAQALLTGKKLDLNLAKGALRDTVRHTARAVALKDVERAICHLFQIEPEDLKSESRIRALSFPRMIGMYLGRKHTGAAYSEVGRFFGGRNHSTVISAEKKVEGWLGGLDERPPLAGFETVAEVIAALERILGT